MLIGVGVLCHISYSVLNYLATSVGEERADFPVLDFLFGGISSSFWCLG